MAEVFAINSWPKFPFIKNIYRMDWLLISSLKAQVQDINHHILSRDINLIVVMARVANNHNKRKGVSVSDGK